MNSEKFYTEVSSGNYIMLCVNTYQGVYYFVDGLTDNEIELEIVDYVAAEIMDAIVKGLEVKGYKEIKI